MSLTARSARQDWHSTCRVSPPAAADVTGAAWTGGGGGGGGGGGATCRDVDGGAAATTGLFRTTVWSFGLAPASEACRCLSASSRVLKIRKNALRPSMSKTTFTLGWTLT